MANGGNQRQDALRLIGRALQALHEDAALEGEDVRALLPAWRTLSPRAHPGAGADLVDAATVARVATWSQAVLHASAFQIARPGFREEPSAEALDDAVVLLRGVRPADALVLALTLSLETAKRRHGLSATPEALRAVFAAPEDARAAFDALARGGDARKLLFAPMDDDTAQRVAAAVQDRPVLLVAGAGAARMHDLLSPFARRMGATLTLVGRGRGPVDDDDAYRGVAILTREDPRTVGERLEAERSDGLEPCGRALVVLTDRLADTSADRRAREALGPLKKSRAAVVLVEDDLALGAVLASVAARTRSIGLIVEASAGATPTLVLDACTGTVTPVPPLPGAQPAEAMVLCSLPSLGMLGDSPLSAALPVPLPTDDHAAGLLQAVWRARAAGTLPVDARVTLQAVRQGDDSGLSRACLALLPAVAAGRARR